MHDAAPAPTAATARPSFASKRSTVRTGIAPAITVNGSISCDSAPQNAIAMMGRHGCSVSQAAIARCMVKRAACATRRAPRYDSSVLVGVRQERQVTRALHGDRELTLIVRLRPGDPARNDLAGLRDVALQDAEILVVDLLDAFGSEAAELAAAEKAGHRCNLSNGVNGRDQASARGESSSPSSMKRSSRVSSSPLAIGEGSVTAASILITRWRSTASLKRKPPVSSPSVLLSHSMFIRT